MARAVYYNIEMLVLPHRWFNDYRSINNVWLPVLVVSALLPGRSRASYYAWLAVVTQLLLRVNTPEAGAMFDRIQHIFPLLTAPALAGFVHPLRRHTGARGRTPATLALYVPTAFAPSGMSPICAPWIRAHRTVRGGRRAGPHRSESPSRHG